MAKKTQDRELPEHAQRAFDEGGSVAVRGVIYTDPDELPEDAFEPLPVQPLHPDVQALVGAMQAQQQAQPAPTKQPAQETEKK